MPHGGLVLFQVDVIAAGQLDLFPQAFKVFHVGPDGFDFFVPVPGLLHFVGDVGVGPYQGGGELVERGALGFGVFEVFGVAGITAEVVLVFQRSLGRLHHFAQGLDGFQGFVQPLAAAGQAAFEEALDVGLVVAAECFGGEVVERFFQAVEQIHVVHNVAVVFVVAVQAVDAADGLEKPVVTELLVNIEIGGRRSVEAGE